MCKIYVGYSWAFLFCQGDSSSWMLTPTRFRIANWFCCCILVPTYGIAVIACKKLAVGYVCYHCKAKQPYNLNLWVLLLGHLEAWTSRIILLLSFLLEQKCRAEILAGRLSAQVACSIRTNLSAYPFMWVLSCWLSPTQVGTWSTEIQIIPVFPTQPSFSAVITIIQRACDQKLKMFGSWWVNAVQQIDA